VHVLGIKRSSNINSMQVAKQRNLKRVIKNQTLTPLYAIVALIRVRVQSMLPKQRISIHRRSPSNTVSYPFVP